MLLTEVFSTDIENTKTTIRNLSRYFGDTKQGKPQENPPTFSIRSCLWKEFHTTMKETRDSTAISNLICIASKAAQVDFLKPFVFDTFPPPFLKVAQDVNDALRVFQEGVLATISTFTTYCVSTDGLDVLRSPGAGKAAILLILSPASEYHTAGVALVGFAFDVDGRIECLRALLENIASESFDGLFTFLQAFQEDATQLVEACELSTTLVRCFADILDVLCGIPGGLLHNSTFLRPKDDNGPAAKLPEFWKHLTLCLARIYNRCPVWAEYIGTPVMILWMRDALILARDVVKQWRIIETASNAHVKAPAKSATAKLSPLGKTMIQSLQEFLIELARWLRLTDEELLHQSFSLLQSLLDVMKEMGIKPSEAAIQKLMKYVERSSGGHDTSSRSSKLDKGRLLQLGKALAYFEDDEVEIVAEKTVSKSAIKNPLLNKIPQPSTSPGSTPVASSSRIQPEKLLVGQRQVKGNFSVPAPSNRLGAAAPISSLSKKGAQTQPQESEHSDSSDDDSEADSSSVTGLASLGRFIKSPRKTVPTKPKARPVERRQIVALDLPSVTNALQERFMRNRQVRNTALRLRPDISGLHKIILSWDYSYDGPMPHIENRLLLQVPDRFENYQHYFQVFQPLLLAECWAQLSQAKEEIPEHYQCRVDNRQYVDDWLDVDLTITASLRKGWYLAETDIVLLQQPDRTKRIMAKVKCYKALPSGVQLTVRLYTRAGPGDPGLQVTTTWQINRVFRYANIDGYAGATANNRRSLSTLHREYAALISIQYNDICHFILNPILPKAPDPEARAVRETMEAHKVNQPQAIAILKAMKTDGFTLIQGFEIFLLLSCGY